MILEESELNQNVHHFTGLIAAACGQLNKALENYGHPGKLLLNNGMSNGQSRVSIHQNGNGNANKSPYKLFNGIYSNGNGIHV